MTGDRTSQKADSFSCGLELHLDCAEKPSFPQAVLVASVQPPFRGSNSSAFSAGSI